MDVDLEPTSGGAEWPHAMNDRVLSKAPSTATIDRVEADAFRGTSPETISGLTGRAA